MSRHVLITGGAGFIGSHLADQLLAAGHRVRALDCLKPQVHGEEPTRPDYLADEVELIRGDVRDPDAVRAALEGIDTVYHFAAMVGVGQSMYQLNEYTSVNQLGTATLLEAIMQQRVDRLVVASSMSVYGEGLYCGIDGRFNEHAGRSVEQMKKGQWEPRDPAGAPLLPAPTPETKTPDLASIYALGKYDQERMCLLVGQAYGIPTTALRFFNVYGPRQALSNPYTGVLAIFASRLLNDRPPMIFEDGRQQRDFVSVYDIARACVLALDADDAAGQVINVGSGQPRTVLEVAEALASVMDKRHITPIVSGEYRVGDIRHCFADIRRAQALLGYEPQMDFERGLEELASWLSGQVAQDRVTEAHAELAARGLTV